MSCSGTSSCICGCCTGTSVQTPQAHPNRPGLNAIAYRVGTWNTFKESMLARLSSADYPALQALKTRANDDFTIAFLDATAIVLDILSFYQERLANESYLGTATQIRSLTELARLIAYQPAPGVAASVYLAFSLKQATAQPSDPSAPPILIPRGTQVQSVPAQDASPQTFETAADIPAKADWNALAVRTGSPWAPAAGDTSMYLDSTATGLQPGDLFLIVGDERANSNSKNNWDIRVIAAVKVDGPNNRTRITWNRGLGGGGVQPAQENPKFYAFRQRAALFGYNSAQPVVFTKDQRDFLVSENLLKPGQTDWDFLASQSSANQNLYQRNLIDLDGVYSKIVPDGWIALVVPDAQITRSPAGEITLYKVNSITTISRSDFAIGAKLSRVAADLGGNHLRDSYIATRAASALVQSEQLAVAEQPLNYPLYGASLELEGLRPDLAGVTAVALTGKHARLMVAAGVAGLLFYPGGDSSKATPLNPGDTLAVVDPAPLPLNADGSIPAAEWNPGGGSYTLNVTDSSRRPGTVSAYLSDFELIASGANDPQITEYALVGSVVAATDPYPHTCIHLQSNLINCYDRGATTVNANVGLATVGRSVTEVVGNGDASTANQAFALKQSPLTYIQAPTPTGRQSTLQVRVNGAAWNEVPTLYLQPPQAQVFATQKQSDGTTGMIFGGDGEGSLLPTGQNNVIANYRIGSGAAGNVAAGTITTLLDRPLGVGGVTNPQSAGGGQDAQSLADIRILAPQTVLTLGRAVSIIDYQNYAATFAGISKASAVWIPSGAGRGVFITVAGVDGAALPAASPTVANLVASLRRYGNPLIPITAVSYVETLFKFSASVQYDPAYDQPTVQASVSAMLAGTFSIGARTFGQSVSVDEIAAAIARVPGVVAVNVTGLARTDSSTAGDLANLKGFSAIAVFNKWMAQAITLKRPFADTPNLLCAYMPVASADAAPQPAEILVIDPRPGAVILGVMS